MSEEPQLTREEHRARAMLLGMTHNYGCHYYFCVDKDGYLRLDEDTLEELSSDEVYKRQKTWA